MQIFSKMKLPSLALLSASTLLATSHVGGVRGCPFDLLAMCCVASENGVCTQWKLCCDLVLSSGDESDETTIRRDVFGGVSLIAEEACVKGCGGGRDDPGNGPEPSTDAPGDVCGARSYSTVSACYESCAVRPDAGGGCIAFVGSASGFGPHDKCCTAVDARGGMCLEWQSCRLVERRPSTFDYYLPIASGGCVDDRCDGSPVASSHPGRGQGLARSSSSSLHDCYDRCATGGEPVGFDGPFGLWAPCLEIPTLLGHANAFVPMTIVSCGLDCQTHGLATEDGNLDMNLYVGMCCDGGTVYSIKVSGLAANDPYAAFNQASPYWDTISVQPFSLEDLDAECEAALGGSWPIPGPPSNSKQTVTTLLEKTVTIEGTCDSGIVKRDYVVSLLITCHDLAFFEPEP